MKYFFTLAVLLCICTTAQSQSYNATYYNAPYAALVAPVQITGVTVWDEVFAPVPIGFPFTFVGQTYTTLYVSNLGYLDFDGGDSIVFAGLVAELVDRNLPLGLVAPSVSPISYQLTGSMPNRILKIEFKNAGFYNDASSFINFQFWLYENDNAIEVHYGDNFVADNDVYENFNGAIVGILQHNTGFTQTLYTLALVGDPAMPDTSEYDFVAMSSLQGTPDSSQVYRFYLLPSAIAGNIVTGINVYPNPVIDKLVLELGAGAAAPLEVTLCDVLGRCVKNIYRGTLVNGINRFAMNVDGFPTGLYSVYVRSNSMTLSKRFLLQ